MYTDILDDIVNKYNNTYHSIIKMKPVDAKPNTYIDSRKEVNNKDPKFKIVILFQYQKYSCKRLCSKLVRRSFFD